MINESVYKCISVELNAQFCWTSLTNFTSNTAAHNPDLGADTPILLFSKLTDSALIGGSDAFAAIILLSTNPRESIAKYQPQPGSLHSKHLLIHESVQMNLLVHGINNSLFYLIINRSVVYSLHWSKNSSEIWWSRFSSNFHKDCMDMFPIAMSRVIQSRGSDSGATLANTIRYIIDLRSLFRMSACIKQSEVEFQFNPSDPSWLMLMMLVGGIPQEFFVNYLNWPVSNIFGFVPPCFYSPQFHEHPDRNHLCMNPQKLPF